MSRVFAIVPAAGSSRRMGQPKLLLPWRGRRLIDFVLEAWTSSKVNHTLVVCRKSDVELQAACREWPVKLICPASDPVDMKESIQCGLQIIDDDFAPRPHEDYWMMAPADLPKLTSHLIDRLIETRLSNSQSLGTVITARYDGHQSHPVLLPFYLAKNVFELAADQGVNHVINMESVIHVDFPAADYASDVDTPDDYRRLQTDDLP